MRGLTFEPYIPLALWLPLALVAAALLIGYTVASRGRLTGRSRPCVLALMAAVLALPLLILLNPTWTESIPPPPGKPRLTILVDASVSMATTDAANGESRYAEALRVAEQVTRELGDLFELRMRAVAEESVPRELAVLRGEQPEGALTDLAAGVEQSLDEQPQGQALLLVSDGVHNAPGGLDPLRQSVAKAHAMAAPIYVKTIGTGVGVHDLEVTLRLPQETSFAGQSVPVAVTVHQRGTLADRTTLSLVLDDTVVEQREIRTAPNGSVEATFSVRQAESGLYRYEIRADAHPAEVTAVNNVATLLLRVVDEPVRILLLEGKPYWDTKFLVRTLATDPSVDLTTVVRMAEGRYLQRHIERQPPADGAVESNGENETVTRATRWATWSDLDEAFSGEAGFGNYQVILLGRDAEVFLSEVRVAQLKRWLIEDNGSLICFRGSPVTQVSQQLAELMPIRWTPAPESRFRVRLTESGRSAQWLPTWDDGQELLADLPSLSTVAQPQRPKPLAVVLATGNGDAQEAAPVISYQPVGNGRVIVVEGAGMWRWAFLPPEHQQFDETYGLLWRSLVRWLVTNSGLLPSQQLALRSDKVTFSTTESATATLLMRETGAAQPPPIQLAGESLDAPHEIIPTPVGSWPGQFRVEFGKLPEGRYRAHVIGATDENASTAVFDVRGNLTERLDVAARPELMRMLAQQSGGAVWEGDRPRQIAEHFHEHLSAARPPRSTKTIAWDRWWVLVTVYGLWAVAWGLRRRGGLI